LQRGTEAHCCRWHGRCVLCVCVCVDVRECLCVIDVAEGHRSALLSLAWQVCILCVYVCVC
jgi:hypothetical protein